MARHLGRFEKFWDARTDGICVYCGAAAETKEHVPPRAFLTKPYPEGLYSVPACRRCNQGHSQDEEYVSQLAECVRFNSLSLPESARRSVRRSIEHVGKRRRIERSAALFTTIGGKRRIAWRPEEATLKRVFEKISVCHVRFEINEFVAMAVNSIELLPWHSKIRARCYEELRESDVWPEIGSRLMQRWDGNEMSGRSQWIVVQPEHYRFTIVLRDGVIQVHGVVRESIQFEASSLI